MVSYFAFNATYIKQGKARNPKIRSDALINNDSPTEYFNFVIMDISETNGEICHYYR